ncbi:MAG: TolB family protein [Thermoleophilaceae bacterium]
MKRGLLAGVLAFVVVALIPAVVHAAFPGRNGPLVIGSQYFARDIEADVFDVRSITPDGRPGDVGLPSCYDCLSFSDPVVSPDGERLAFRLGNGIGVAAADGSGLRALAGLPPGAGSPAWSPDGREIVFAADGSRTGKTDLFVAPVEVGAPRQLTDTPGVSERAPTWGTRPVGDGGLIAYERARRLWTVHPDGERVRRLTGREGLDPSFSPHASKIAFVRRSQVYTVGARGGGLNRVTDRGGLSPSWSPNGRRIAFLRFRGRAGIYRVGPRGRALRRIQRLFADSACGCFSANSLDWGPRR